MPPQWDARDRVNHRHPYPPHPPGRAFRFSQPPSRERERDYYPDRGYEDRDRDTHRDFEKSPPRPQSPRPRPRSRSRSCSPNQSYRHSHSRSRSPSSASPHRHRKHRLSSGRTPVLAYSPPSRDYGPDKIHDQRMRAQEWDRPWSRNGTHWGSRRSRELHDHDRGHHASRPRGDDGDDRPVSPPSHTQRTPAPPLVPPSDSVEPPTVEDPMQVIVKDETLPAVHPAIVFALRRPNAPRDDHSPSPLPLPPAKEEDVRRARERRNTLDDGIIDEKGEAEPGQPHEISEGGKLVVAAGRKEREPVQRTRKEEMEAYGRTFEGCGMQKDYNVTTKLGEGTFGEVHKAVQVSTGHAVALKRILMHNENEGMPVTALREIKILKAMKHPCIVDIVDMFVVRSKGKASPLSVYMVFPYMDHDLAGLLENDRVKLQPSHIKLYMMQLLEGTEYMHRNHILHRDMKAANLLISNTGSLRIADFGLARAFDPSIVLPPSSSGVEGQGKGGKEKRYTNCVVTRWYRPPELLLGARQYGGEVDIWGIGCVLGEMFLHRPILPGTSDIDQLEKIWQLCGTPNQHTWPNFDALPGCEGVKRFHNYPKKLGAFTSIGPETCDLLDKLLTCNPRDRITASQALDHEYFWTDPLPADPKTLPTYEPSHEFDKRGRRNFPIGPPAQHPLPPPEHVRPSLQHGQGYYGHGQGHGHGHGRGPRNAPPPPPVMLTALMQQGQQGVGVGAGGAGAGYGQPPGGYGQPSGPYEQPPGPYGQPPGPYGQPPAGAVDGYGPPPLYGHGRYQPHGYAPYGPPLHMHGGGDMDRPRYGSGERGGRRGGSAPMHPSLPQRPAGLPPKPVAPLGSGVGRNEKDNERGRDRGGGRDRGRYGGGAGSGGGGTSGGLPYS
ncbi:hypothetical protein PAXINDRAFT_134877 [Paxillus involutus ATCC 200175]|uniref:Protein kinase domain-containing protein n=1 Tax=Paxillus involutus ATCC 200175 TaxID=664439 RepID=A0A0C9SXV0_PAXIN|nr:hypothetical protein PAXINDRAFT_134877 [Paxillus involutus ATCC 200175]